MKKVWFLLAALTIVISLLQLPAFAIEQSESIGEIVKNSIKAEPGDIYSADDSFSNTTLMSNESENSIPVQGTWAQLNWEVNSNGTLTISGIGPMAEGYSHKDYPWMAYADHITSIIIEDGVTSVGINAFSFGLKNELEAIYIGKGVETINHISNYTREYRISLENKNYVAMDGVLFSKDLTRLIAYPACSTNEAYSIPDSVKRIEQAAFAFCENMKNVQIPDSVTDIGSQAFLECQKLERIVFPDSVTYLFGSGILAGCTELSSVILPKRIRTIPADFISGCSKLEVITIPASVQSIHPAAFGFCKSLRCVTFLGEKPYFWEDAFMNTETTVQYPGFYDSWTDAVNLNYGGNLTWKPYATSAQGTCGTSLNWQLENGVLTISGTGAMHDYDVVRDTPPWDVFAHEVTKLIVEEGVSRIGSNAFRNCTVLRYAEFPSTLAQVGQQAFYQVFLSKINQTVREWSTVQIEENNDGFPFWDGTSFLNKPPIVASGILGEKVYWEMNQNGNAEIFGIGDMYYFWATASPFVDLPIESVVIGEGITSIGDCTFEAFPMATLANTLKSVIIPSSVKSIGVAAFRDCRALSSITFTGNAPSINEIAFDRIAAVCYYPNQDNTWTVDVRQNYGGSLTWLPYCISHVEEIDNSVEATCTDEGKTEGKHCSVCGEILIAQERIPALGHKPVAVEAVAPSSSKEGHRAGEACERCSEIIKGMEIIPAVPKQWDMTLPETTRTIENEAFYGINALYSVRLPNNCTYIGANTFADCGKLLFICIPNGDCVINPIAFGENTNVIVVTLPGSSTAKQAAKLGLLCSDING